MVSESAEKRIPFVSDEASSLKDEETTAEQASLFIEFLTLNGLNSMSTSASKSSPLNIAIFAFIRYWRRKGILAPQHIVSANAIYRFLTDDCNIRKEVTIKSFNNVFNHCEDMKIRKWMIKWQISLPIDDFIDGQILILFSYFPKGVLPYLCTRNQASKVWLRAFLFIGIRYRS